MNNRDREILLIAQEECAEVIQAISKIFRFGFDAQHPNEDRNNLQRLEEELGDLACRISCRNEIEKVKDLVNHFCR
jgi:NTP pyrophosphatase (non-canonical NTP hydrolase)